MTDAVVVDYAPAAQLAALVAGLPVLQITNGFDVPPPQCPVFGVVAEGPMLDRRNQALVRRIDETIERVCSDLRRDLFGASLEKLLQHPARWYDCVAETDPYGAREDGLYLGPFANDLASAEPSWPAGRLHAPRAFVYLRNAAQIQAVTAALTGLNAQAILVCPDLDDDRLAKLRSQHLHFTRSPVSLRPILNECDVVVSYGPSATATRALLSGKPQLILPTDVEKWLIGSRIALSGTALMLDGAATADRVAEQLIRLVDDPGPTTKAAEIASKYLALSARLTPAADNVIRSFLQP